MFTHLLMFEGADEQISTERFGDALAAYLSAWSRLQKDLNETRQVWLLLSIANAAVRLGDYEEALSALSVLPECYA